MAVSSRVIAWCAARRRVAGMCSAAPIAAVRSVSRAEMVETNFVVSASLPRVLDSVCNDRSAPATRAYSAAPWPLYLFSSSIGTPARLAWYDVMLSRASVEAR